MVMAVLEKIRELNGFVVVVWICFSELVVLNLVVEWTLIMCLILLLFSLLVSVVYCLKIQNRLMEQIGEDVY